MTTLGHVRLVAFAAARDLIGAARAELPLAGSCTAGELWAELVRHYPVLAPYRGTIRLAVNGRWAEDDARVSVGDEVALLPPVSGG
jgi:sulfur-carrier protein